MKTSITKGLRRGFRAAGIGAAVAVAIGFTSVGAANADTFVPPLQDGSITQTLPGDVVVTVSTTGESANINPSMGSTPPVHRNVWVSGSAQVKLSGAGAKNVNYFRIMPGYVVGCQVDITGSAGGGANGSAGASSTTTIVDTPEGEAVVAAGSNTSNGSGGLSATWESRCPRVRPASSTCSPWSRRTPSASGCSAPSRWSRRPPKVASRGRFDRGYLRLRRLRPGPQLREGHRRHRDATQQVTLWGGQPFSIG